MTRVLGGLVLLLVATASWSQPVQWRRGQQVVVVQAANWSSPAATLRTFERRWWGWREIGAPIAVSLGRNGSAWGQGLHPSQPGVQKREGDGRAPAGLFAIGLAFGVEPALTTGLSYRPMSASDWCIDVPGSPYYNRLVDRDQVGADAIVGSSEPMRRDLHLGDDLYRLGFVIEHNQAQLDRAGSCIFAHLWRAPLAPTAGCTAMAEVDLERLLAWLDRTRQPRFVLLPKSDYQRLRGPWRLPKWSN